MKYRVAMWAAAGFSVAAFWAMYALAMPRPALTYTDPIMMLVRLTCPIVFLRSYPLSLLLVLVANTGTYALAGVIVESLRQQLHHAK